MSEPRPVVEINILGTGDQLIQIHVFIPKKVNKDEEQLLEKLLQSEHFSASNAKKDKGFFDRMKEWF